MRRLFLGKKKKQEIPLEYLRFTLEEDSGSVSTKYSVNTEEEGYVPPTLEYRVNGTGDWNAFVINNTGVLLNKKGDYVELRGDNSYFSTQKHQISFVFGDGLMSVSGNIMSLYSKSLDCDEVSTWGFARLFEGCTQLINAPDLPANKVGVRSYFYIFNKCQNITECTNVLAEELDEACFGYMYSGTGITHAQYPKTRKTARLSHLGMFAQCKSLKTADDITKDFEDFGDIEYGCFQSLFLQSSIETAPTLYPEKMSAYCYCSTFSGCESLVTPPIIYAKISADYCFQSTFKGCTSLTQCADISKIENVSAYMCQDMYYGCTSIKSVALNNFPNTTATTAHCYHGMFSGCTSLSNVSMPTASFLSDYCYYGMFYGCTSITSTVNLSCSEKARHCYASMYSGCTKLTTITGNFGAPLSEGCFYRMFADCTAMSSFSPSLSAVTLVKDCYNSMFYGCTSLYYPPSIGAQYPANSAMRMMFYNCKSLRKVNRLFFVTVTANDGYCCEYMYYGCNIIGLYTSSSSSYKTRWRIPYSTSYSPNIYPGNFTSNMFSAGSVKTPSTNVNYYTNVDIVV